MSGLKNTAERLASVSVGGGYATKKERKARKAAKVQAGKDTMFAGAELPDEELIKRNERRKAASRRGSRVKTVLTDRETLG
jgi:hypothetical protein